MSKPADKRIPFEPSKRRKKQEATKPPVVAPPSPSVALPKPQPRASKDAFGMPQTVSQRMVRRAAIFCGVPTLLGILTFVSSYIVVVNHWAELPNILVVLTSMAWFGLGVLGLSYGAISASWDENRVGTWWGWQDFQHNFQILFGALRQQQQEAQDKQKKDTN